MRIGLTLLLIGFFGISNVWSQQLETESGPVEIVAIWIYADWCEDCEESEEAFEKLKEQWHQNGTYFRKFDMSDEFTRTGAREFAELMGLEDILEEHETDAGTFILVDAPDRKTMTTYEDGFGYTEVNEKIRERLEAED